ncbi:MAG: hypothetical protein ACYT04_86500, partial [Nostoc sp.]
SIKLSLSIILAFLNAIPAQAQLAKPTNSVQPSTGNASQEPKKRLIFQTPPPPPPSTDAPGQRRGGGSRGCLNETTQNVQLESKLLTALVPEYSSLRVVWGLTTQQRPTFW